MSSAPIPARWRLTRDRIRPTGIAAGWPVEVVESTGSTNADLMAAVRDGLVFAVDPTSIDASCIGGNVA
ncbi:biotin--[acetyl-CoA-carboxylase] ligase, partial [Ralstonia pseudosolanacearum]